MAELITAFCPECLSRYRLKPDLVGKRMRCTNSNCRSAFEIVADFESSKVGEVRRPDQDRPLSGTGNGLKEGDEPAFDPRDEADWRAAPPPVQIIVEDDTPTPVEKKSLEDAVGFRQRRPEPPKPPREPAPVARGFAPPPRKRNFGPFLVISLSVLVGLIFIAAIILLVREAGRAEDRLAAEASEYYTAGQFGKAADTYGELARRYRNGVRAAEYRFMASLSTVRHRAGVVPPEPDPALAALTKFLDEHGKDAFLKDRRVDLYDAVLMILNHLIDDGMERISRKPADLDGAESRLSLARKALGYLGQNAPSSADTATPKAKVDTLASAIAMARAKDAARKEILALLASPQPDLDTARDLIRRAGFENDPEIMTAWARAEETLRKLVMYRKLDVAAKPTGTAHPPVNYPDARQPAAAGPRVPALARGVLWALESKTGKVAWVDRLGVDATLPPIRIPGGDDWLVIASEPPSLSLRDSATGAMRWYQPLDALPVGPAVLAGRRGFLALGGARGKILNFDATTGTITGAFETGQPFAGGIALRPGTNLLYAPAASQQVYVLDTAPEGGKPPFCLTTLTTGHTAGTLRHPPAIVGDTYSPSLLLAAAEGLGDTALTLYRLDMPVGSALSAITARLPGWTWFAPYHDVERIAAVTDRGALGVFAFRRSSSVDPALYPLEDRDAAPPLPDGSPQRALVVHADESGLVVLANGKLSQWRAGIDRVKGRRLVHGWSLEQPLGSPLHEPASAGAGIVMLTTLRADTAGAMATAVDVNTGEVIWQRPLGLAPGDQLLQVGPAVASIDDRGGMVLFEPATRGADGRLPGKQLAVAVPGITGTPTITRSATGTDWIVSPTAQGVVLRSIDGEGRLVEKKIALPAALAGIPAIGEQTAVMPLANGSLIRVSMNDDAVVAVGPSWRSPGVTADAAGIIVMTRADKYLISDGGRRLMKLSWPAPQQFELDSGASLELSARPTRLARDPSGAFVAAADDNGVVTLIEVAQLHVVGKLGTAGRAITAGPVFSEGDVLFVSDHKELEAVSTSNITRRWQFTTPGDGLSGMSLLIDQNLRVIADRSGQLFVIRSSKGVVTKAVFALPSGSPVGRPLAFGNDSLLIPLVDGTVSIVAKKDLPTP